MPLIQPSGHTDFVKPVILATEVLNSSLMSSGHCWLLGTWFWLVALLCSLESEDTFCGDGEQGPVCQRDRVVADGYAERAPGS